MGALLPQKPVNIFWSAGRIDPNRTSAPLPPLSGRRTGKNPRLVLVREGLTFDVCDVINQSIRCELTGDVKHDDSRVTSATCWVSERKRRRRSSETVQ